MGRARDRAVRRNGRSGEYITTSSGSRSIRFEPVRGTIFGKSLKAHFGEAALIAAIPNLRFPERNWEGEDARDIVLIRWRQYYRNVFAGGTTPQRKPIKLEYAITALRNDAGITR